MTVSFSPTSDELECSSQDYRQPERGYRFSRDSVLLAKFLPEELPGRVADLGAGCGVVGLEALTQGRLKGIGTLCLIEAEEVFREPLTANIRLFGERLCPEIKSLIADWRTVTPEILGGPLDYIAVNPPYFPIGSSPAPKRLDQDGSQSHGCRDGGGQGHRHDDDHDDRGNGRRTGRHETLGDLGDLFQAAKRLLKAGGGLALSWPRARLDVLTVRAAENGFSLIRLELPLRPGNGLVLAEYVLETDHD